MDKILILKEYPVGTRILLIHTTDPYTRLQAGMQGVVRYVDDMGTVHVSWDNGSQLGMIIGEDQFEKLMP